MLNSEDDFWGIWKMSRRFLDWKVRVSVWIKLKRWEKLDLIVNIGSKFGVFFVSRKFVVRFVNWNMGGSLFDLNLG